MEENKIVKRVENFSGSIESIILDGYGRGFFLVKVNVGGHQKTFQLPTLCLENYEFWVGLDPVRELKSRRTAAGYEYLMSDGRWVKQASEELRQFSDSPSLLAASRSSETISQGKKAGKDLRPFTLKGFVEERRAVEEDPAILDEFLARHNPDEKGAFYRFERGFESFKEKIYGLRGKCIAAPGGDLVNL